MSGGATRSPATGRMNAVKGFMTKLPLNRTWLTPTQEEKNPALSHCSVKDKYRLENLQLHSMKEVQAPACCWMWPDINSVRG